MSTDASEDHTDLLAIIDGREPAPTDLSPVAAGNLVRIRRGIALLRDQPGHREGRRLWQQAIAEDLGVSERTIRVMVSAAQSIIAAGERAETLPTSILERYLSEIPNAIDAWISGAALTEPKPQDPNRNERLQRWRTRAKKTLSAVDQAGTIATRLDAAEQYLVEVQAKVDELRKAKAHADAQPRVRHAHLAQMPFVLVPWRGASLIDGGPVRVILSCVKMQSGSRKTGDMVQLVITRDDVDPSTALQSGLDTSVCGDCLHRPQRRGGLGSCYVTPAKREVRPPWVATVDVAADLDAAVEAIRLARVPLRVGRYGNPSAMPLSIAEQLLTATRDHRGRLHYTDAGDLSKRGRHLRPRPGAVWHRGPAHRHLGHVGRGRSRAGRR